MSATKSNSSRSRREPLSPPNNLSTFRSDSFPDRSVLCCLCSSLGGPMTKLTAKVINPKATYWYAGLEGETFEVYRFGSTYVLAEDYDRGPDVTWRHLVASDVEIV